MQRSIILAGGEGERTRRFIKRWLGSHRPKQYCRFVGRRSMFQHTVDRADRTSPGVHRFSVVSEGHRSFVRTQLRGRPTGRLLRQPENRGTAAGILWPISCLMRKHPDDVVVIYPSDHFIWPEGAFVSAVSAAVREVERNPDRVVLLGRNPLAWSSTTAGFSPMAKRAASAPVVFEEYIASWRSRPRARRKARSRTGRSGIHRS